MKLVGYWRSTASYRVRIALALKDVCHEQATLDLRTGAQREVAFRKVNPQGLVPVLETDDGTLIQSPAILEWLEERYPLPALLPSGSRDRAIVRAMAALVACDIHPLNNLRVLDAVRAMFQAGPDQINQWIGRWIYEGFGALEAMITLHGDGFAFGDQPTLADCYLVPQVYAAERFGIDLSPFPRLSSAADRARGLPAFAAAHPNAQSDADR